MSIYMQLKYKTKFTDKEILKETLKEANVGFFEQNKEIICNTRFYQLHFKKNKEGEYEIQTRGYNDWKDEIITFRENLTPIYNRLAKESVQKEICNNIKSKVTQSSSMNLIHEEILEDNSIVLTISI